MHSKTLGGGGGVSDTGPPVFVRGSHELSVPCLQWNSCVSNYQFRESQIQLNNKVKNQKKLIFNSVLKNTSFHLCYLNLISEKQIEN